MPRFTILLGETIMNMQIQFSLVYCLMLAGANTASGQCYRFSSGNAASVTLNITNLPAPVMIPYGYSYFVLDVTKDAAAVTIGPNSYTILPPSPDVPLQLDPRFRI